MKAYWRVGWRHPPLFHNLGTRLECSFSHPGHFTLRNRASNTHRIRGWVDPRFSMDILENRKISWPCQESKPDHPFCNLVNTITILSQREIPQQLGQQYWSHGADTLTHNNIFRWDIPSCVQWTVIHSVFHNLWTLLQEEIS